MRTAPFKPYPTFAMPMSDEAARALAAALHERGELLGGANGALPGAEVLARATAELGGGELRRRQEHAALGVHLGRGAAGSRGTAAPRHRGRRRAGARVVHRLPRRGRRAGRPRARPGLRRAQHPRQRPGPDPRGGRVALGAARRHGRAPHRLRAAVLRRRADRPGLHAQGAPRPRHRVVRRGRADPARARGRAPDVPVHRPGEPDLEQDLRRPRLRAGRRHGRAPRHGPRRGPSLGGCGADPAPHPVPRRRRRRAAGRRRAARPERRAAPVHAVGGCELFPADNPWNRRIDERPVWKQSRGDRRASRPPGHDLHLDLGTTEEYYGIPVNVVDEDQPLLPLQFGVDGEDYGDESDRGPVFVPADAAIEGGSTRDPDPDSGRPARDRRPPRHLRPHRAVRRRAGARRLGQGRRLAGRRGRALGPVVQPAPPGPLDLRRRRRPADPARAALLRRGGVGPDHPRAALHPAERAARLHVAGPPLRPERQHRAGPAGVRPALPAAEVVPGRRATPAPPGRSSSR